MVLSNVRAQVRREGSRLGMDDSVPGTRTLRQRPPRVHRLQPRRGGGCRLAQDWAVNSLGPGAGSVGVALAPKWGQLEKAKTKWGF